MCDKRGVLGGEVRQVSVQEARLPVHGMGDGAVV